MDPDLLLSLGLIIAALSIPSVLSALSERRAPRASAVTILISGAMILYAASSKPGGYQIDQIPRIVISTLSQIVP